VLTRRDVADEVGPNEPAIATVTGLLDKRDLATAMMDAAWPLIYAKQLNQLPTVAPSRAEPPA
jgi:hypothetical protein